MDEGWAVDVFYLDLSKAFDTVPHERLLSKVEACGIRGSCLRWIQNFLNQRLQRVVGNGAESKWIDVLSGVPQGCILGPVLFLLYVNDIPSVVSGFVRIYLRMTPS